MDALASREAKAFCSDLFLSVAPHIQAGPSLVKGNVLPGTLRDVPPDQVLPTVKTTHPAPRTFQLLTCFSTDGRISF